MLALATPCRGSASGGSHRMIGKARERQSYAQTRRIFVEGEVRIVLARDRCGYCEPQSRARFGSAFVQAPEGFENRGAQVCRYAMPRIGDTEIDALWGDVNAHINRSSARRMAHRVLDQVGKACVSGGRR
jgi:hypothetical protein